MPENWQDAEQPADMSDALANVVWALEQMRSALADGRYRFEEIHVGADVSYLLSEARRATRQRTERIAAAEAQGASRVREAVEVAIARRDTGGVSSSVNDIRAALAQEDLCVCDGQAGTHAEGSGGCHFISTDVLDVVFDRMPKVRRRLNAFTDERLAEIKAEAWDEGFQASEALWEWANDSGPGESPSDANPYRAATPNPESEAR